MKKLALISLLLASCASYSFNVVADMNSELLDIQHQWVKVNYELTDKAQEQGFEQLVSEITQFQQTYSDKAEGYIWLGIIKSSYAGAKGGLGALGLAKEAKVALEKALLLDATALDGSAYTSLGTLYSKVPGWPIGFGDDEKAAELLSTAIKINSKGIDPNYFYGQYLYEEKKYSEAKTYLEMANRAPARAERPLADQYRHQEIDQLLVKVNKKLKNK